MLFFFVAITLSLLPDFELLFVYITGATRAVWHRTLSHSIAFCLIVAWVVSFVPPLSKRFGRTKVFVLSATALLLHLVLDYFDLDQNPPKGIMLLFPFSTDFHMATMAFLGANLIKDIFITTGVFLVVRLGISIKSNQAYAHFLRLNWWGRRSSAIEKEALNSRSQGEY